jgi:hypothetical protein
MTSVLQTLKDALMLYAIGVKDKMNVHATPYSRSAGSRKSKGKIFTAPSTKTTKHIEQVVQPKINESDTNPTINHISNGSASKLCHLQM